MSTRDYSKKQEEFVANYLGGEVVRNSGATSLHKGDVITNNCLIECKTMTTKKTQQTIKKDWIYKNKQEALEMGREYNAVVIDFGNIGEEYAIISLDLLNELLKGGKY